MIWERHKWGGMLENGQKLRKLTAADCKRLLKMINNDNGTYISLCYDRIYWSFGESELSACLAIG